MWVWVTFFILFVGLISIVQLVLNRKWELIYTAYGYEDYFKYISKLKDEGVKYKVELPLNGRGERVIKDSTQYDIYIKKK